MLDLKTIKTALFDMDGVLYRGARALPGVNEIFAFLDAHGIAYACITNNAARTPAQVAARSKELGLHVQAERVMTSSVATNVYLRSVAAAGTRVYAVGMDGLTEQLFGDGYFVDDATAPEYVVVGVDFGLTYDKLRIACLAIRAGATFIGTNPDKTFPAEEGIVPGAGALLAALAAATDREPMIVGKPQPAMFQAALALLNARPATTLMVGDRYDTDVVGGAQVGLQTALVLTGISDREEAERGPVPPSLIVADLPELLQRWQAALA